MFQAKIEALHSDNAHNKYDQEECRQHVATSTAGSSLVSATCLASKHNVEYVRSEFVQLSGCLPDLLQ